MSASFVQVYARSAAKGTSGRVFWTVSYACACGIVVKSIVVERAMVSVVATARERRRVWSPPRRYLG